jgi:hypothetical protein
MVARIRKVPHVTAVSAALYSPTFLSGPLQSKGRSSKAWMWLRTGVERHLRRLKPAAWTA